MAEKKASEANRLEWAKFSAIADIIGSVLNNIIKWSGIVAVCYFAYQSIEVIAGKETLFDLCFNVMSNTKAATSLPFAVGFSGIGYGLFYRRQNKKTIEHFEYRKTKLEKKSDPGRKSSNITRQGETRPGDKL